MKKIALFLLALLLGYHVFAQDTDNSAKQNKEQPSKKETEKHKINRPLRCPSLYITTSAGINNNTGLVGFSFDVPVDKYFSVEAGTGLSSWGVKIALSGKYYLKSCQRGWAFGAGPTYNTGKKDFQHNFNTVNGKEDVTLDLQPQTNLFAAAYYYWSLGKRYNRFYLEFGWSLPLSGDKYDETSGDPLSGISTDMMKLRSPGGLIIGAGFSFGLL